MRNAPLSGSQKLLLRLFGGTPERRAAMEAESRSWIVECPACHYGRSVWDMGGVRYRAAGNARQLLRCPQCGKTGWHRLVQAATPVAVTADPLPPGGLPRWALWTLVLGLFGAVIVSFVFVLILVIGTLTQPVVTAGDGFMAALHNGDYAQAYAACTPELQQQLGSAAQIGTLAAGRRPATWTWTSRSIRNGVGRLDGPFTYTDGKPGTAHLTFREVDSAWKLTRFALNPSPP
jgi:hypothetical protein